MIRHLVALGLGTGWALPAIAQQPNPSFNLVNHTRNVINEVYASPAGMTSWGHDRLGDVTIAPGRTAPIRLPADGNCIYDVQVVYANGHTDEQRELNTCIVDNVVFPAAGAASNGARSARAGASNDPSFRLANHSRQSVNEVYVSPAGDDDWGQDRLGDAQVPPGNTRVIRLPVGQCVYDVRVVYVDGDATERRHLNLCNTETLSVP